MTRKFRRRIFYLLVLIFALAAPLTILYAIGFSYDWENKRLLKTGAFYFRSIPKKAQIYVNGQQKDSSPALIEHLLPGDYEIEVSKEGYLAWKKTLKINSQLVTEARNIFLIPQEPKIFSTELETATSSRVIFLNQTQRDSFEKGSTTASLMPDVSVWTNSEDKIYYLQKTRIAYRADLDGKNIDQISLQALPLSENWKLITRGGRLAALSPDAGLFLLGPDGIFKKTADEAAGAIFSADTKKMLYWSQHEIWVMWLEENLIQPARQAGDKELITRLAKNIKQAAWFAETGEHIFLALEGENGSGLIKFIELDRRDHRNAYDIFSGPFSEIFYSEKENLLYIQDGLNFYSLDIF